MGRGRRISTSRRSPPLPGAADSGRGDLDPARRAHGDGAGPAGHPVRPAVDRCRRGAAVPPDGGIAVKPIGRFLDQLRRIEADDPRSRPHRGGRRRPGRSRTGSRAGGFGSGAIPDRLVSRHAGTAGRRAGIARRVAVSALVDASVEIVCGVTAGSFQDGRLALSDGSLLDAAGAFGRPAWRGARFLADRRARCDARAASGDSTLRSISHPAVFAAGDCASIQRRRGPRPGSGRCGPGLRWRNLRLAPPPAAEALAAAARGSGDSGAGRREGGGVAQRAGAVRPVVWRWKDRIDRRWMRMYTEMRMHPGPGAPMRCGGCGAKVGPRCWRVRWPICPAS